MSTPLLALKDLHVQIEDKPIIKGINLEINTGEVHAIMGPNGSGKSTLSNTLMGHPKYEVTAGQILYKGEDITELSPDERARAGLFLAFQYPTAIPGVSVANFLRTAIKSHQGDDFDAKNFRKNFRAAMEDIGIDESFATRHLNDGFSGGEKKRHEVLQMRLLKPSLAVLDETDSGLDIDALKTVAEGINTQRGEDIGILMITHYQRLLNYVEPDFVHVFVDGNIVDSGGKELSLKLEQNGYAAYEAAAAQ